MSNISPVAILYPEVDLVGVNFRKTGITESTFFLLVDKSNASGKYKHGSGDGIFIEQVHGLVRKNNSDDKWECHIGVCLSIDGTGMTVASLRAFGSISIRDTSILEKSLQDFSFPSPIDLTVSGGDLDTVLTNYKPYTTDVNTGAPIEDTGGDSVVPAPGDLVLFVQKAPSATGNLDVHYTVTYYVN